MKKNFICRNLQSNKYGAQLHIQLAARREFMIEILQCILNKNKYFHRLESASSRNNIHPNNKQKSEITNENTRKTTCQYGQPV